MPDLIEDGSLELTGSFRLLIDKLMEHLKELDKQVDELDVKIKEWHRESDVSRKLEKIPGIGPVTASALIATIGDAKNFDNGRQMAAWLGLVPKQHSSGGKNTLLGISKRGDAYLRTLLIHGARAVIYARQKSSEKTGWLNQLLERKKPNIAAVALANKNARIVWALLTKDCVFQLDHQGAQALV